MVAGERPAGLVGAMQSRRQADDEQARRRNTEAGNRRIEVFGIIGAIVAAERDQPRTMRAIPPRLFDRLDARSPLLASWAGADHLGFGDRLVVALVIVVELRIVR